MTDLSVTVPLPDVDVNCPHCDAELTAHREDFRATPLHLLYYGKAIVVCDHCDTEFTVFIGDN